MHKYEYLMFFPILTSGVFVFSSVSAFRRRLPSPHSHSLAHSYSLTLTHTLTHSHTHSYALTHTHSHSHTHSLTFTHSRSLTQTHTLTLTHSLTHSHLLTHSLTLTTHALTHSYAFCVAGMGQCEQLRGQMYALASLGLRVFCVMVWDNVHSQGSDVRPGVPRAPPLLRGRHGIMKGSDVCPGIPRAPRFLRGSYGTMYTAKGKWKYNENSIKMDALEVSGF